MRVLLVALVAALASPALAEEAAPKGKSSDPNRMICKSQEVIGSRLQSKRTCMTAMQWDQLRREERSTIERIQQYKPNQG